MACSNFAAVRKASEAGTTGSVANGAYGAGGGPVSGATSSRTRSARGAGASGVRAVAFSSQHPCGEPEAWKPPCAACFRAAAGVACGGQQQRFSSETRTSPRQRCALASAARATGAAAMKASSNQQPYLASTERIDWQE